MKSYTYQDELLQFKELKQVMIQMEKADYPGILTCPPKTAEGDRVHKAYTLATIKRYRCNLFVHY